MTKLQPYAAYKDSGFEWLGRIPTQWRVVPSKWLFRLRTERPDDDAVHLMASQKYGVISQAQFMAETDKRVVQTIVGGENMKKICMDDFLIHLRSFQGGIEWSANEGKVSPAYTVLRPNNGVHPPFFYYLLKSVGYIQELRATTNQLRDGQSMNYSQFALVPLVEVPWEEQVAIANFLDRETAQIDDLIAKQEQLIGLLVEKRQAIISQAVTKGTDPTTPTKPSGQAYLGEIPTHWIVRPFSLAAEYQEGPGIMAGDFLEEGVPLLRIAGVKDSYASLVGCKYLDPVKVATRWSHFRLQLEDILISASASMGTVSEVGPETAGSIAYTGIIRLRPRAGTAKEFLKLLVVSDPFLRQIELHKTGSTMQHYGPSHLSQMRFAFPPTSEQLHIVNHVAVACSKVDDLLEKARASIELLKERRSALISAAVTGKIDARVESVLP